MKVAYLKRRHTHCPVDRLIGMASTHFSNKNLPNFGSFSSELYNAFNKSKSANIKLYRYVYFITNHDNICIKHAININYFYISLLLSHRVVGITDYERMLSDINLNPSKITNITAVQVIIFICHVIHTRTNTL